MAIGFFPKMVAIGDAGGDGRYIFGGAITAPGTLYAVGNILTAVGGTAIQPFIVQVDTVDGGGGVTGISRTQVGAYVPAFPSTFTYSGGGGTGFQTSATSQYQDASYIAERLSGGDLGGSFDQMTFSCWACVGNGGSDETIFYALNTSIIDGQYFEIKVRKTGVGTPTDMEVEVEVNIPVQTGGGAFTAFYFQGVFSGTVPFYVLTESGVTSRVRVINALVSFDTVTQAIQVYANDTALTLDSGPGWLGSGAIINGSGVAWRQWASFVPAPLGAVACGVGDVWVDVIKRDLSDTAIRRKWINANLTAVALPTSGQLPGGGAIPIIFLHTTSAGVAADFIANGGTGSAWLVKNDAIDGSSPNATIYGLSLFTALSFEAAGACIATSPPTGGGLNMDNIIVTSLLTESPCTAALFDPVFGATGPSLGLRWSDTRGADFESPVPQSFSDDPEWQPVWRRTGMARDRVFELFWSASVKTALNGAFVVVAPLKS